MLHPSYTDLIHAVNSEVEPGENLIVNSRYSIVLATAKRARQIIDGSKPMVSYTCSKPLSIAVDELYQGKVKICTDETEAKLNENEAKLSESGIKSYENEAELDIEQQDIKYMEYQDTIHDI